MIPLRTHLTRPLLWGWANSRSRTVAGRVWPPLTQKGRIPENEATRKVLKPVLAAFGCWWEPWLPARANRRLLVLHPSPSQGFTLLLPLTYSRLSRPASLCVRAPRRQAGGVGAFILQKQPSTSKRREAMHKYPGFLASSWDNFRCTLHDSQRVPSRTEPPAGPSGDPTAKASSAGFSPGLSHTLVLPWINSQRNHFCRNLFSGSTLGGAQTKAFVPLNFFTLIFHAPPSSRTPLKPCCEVLLVPLAQKLSSSGHLQSR